LALEAATGGGASAIPLPSRCPLCGAESFFPIWHFSGVQQGCCPSCGHVYSRVPPSWVVDYGHFGQNYSLEWLLAPDNDLYHLARQRAVLAGAGPGRALELGCGYGHFLHTLELAGWSAVGVEPSRTAACFARHQLAATVVEGLAGELALPPGPFDLIAAFHLLEHLPAPLPLLRQLRGLLAPGGRLLLAVPNLRTLPVDLHEGWFIARGLHRHTFLPETLHQLLASAGFSVTHTAEEPATRLSPSSYRVVAQPVAAARNDDAAPAPGCVLARDYHARLDRACQQLHRRFAVWRAEGLRVGIFGAGQHTEALLALAHIGSAEVALLLDDDPARQGQQLAGIPIYTAAGLRRCDVVVVSTLAAEVSLCARLRRAWPQLPIYGIYADLLQESPL